MPERMGSMAKAKEWTEKYRPLFPENELFTALNKEEETQPEVVIDAKLEAYELMLDAKIKRLREQPPDQP